MWAPIAFTPPGSNDFSPQPKIVGSPVQTTPTSTVAVEFGLLTLPAKAFVVVYTTEYASKTTITNVLVTSAKGALCQGIGIFPAGSDYYVSRLEASGCPLTAYEGLYTLFVYVEDDMGTNDGTLSEPMDLRMTSLQASNYFQKYPSFPAAGAPGAPNATNVVAEFTPNGTGRVYAGVTAPGRCSVAPKVFKEPPAGTSKDSPFLCQTGAIQVAVANSSQSIAVPDCNLPGGQTYALNMYLEDVNDVTDFFAGTRASVNFTLPKSNFFQRARVSAQPTASGASFEVAVAADGYAWAAIVDADNVEDLNVAAVKQGVYALGSASCRKNGVAVYAGVNETVLNTTTWTLVECNLVRKRAYAFYLYVEDERGLDDGTLLGPFALPLDDYSNYFETGPYGLYLRGTPSSDSLTFGLTARDTGRVWVAISDPATSATILPGPAFGSDAGPSAAQIANLTNETDAYSLLNVVTGAWVKSGGDGLGSTSTPVAVTAGQLANVDLSGLSLVGGKTYLAYFYLEDGLNKNDGVLAALPFSVPTTVRSNAFSIFPYLDATIPLVPNEFGTLFQTNTTGEVCGVVVPVSQAKVVTADNIKSRLGIAHLINCYGDIVADGSLQQFNFTSCNLLVDIPYAVFLFANAINETATGAISPGFVITPQKSNELTAVTLTSIPDYSVAQGSSFTVNITTSKSGKIWIGVYPLSTFTATITTAPYGNVDYQYGSDRRRMEDTAQLVEDYADDLYYEEGSDVVASGPPPRRLSFDGAPQFTSTTTPSPLLSSWPRSGAGTGAVGGYVSFPFSSDLFYEANYLATTADDAVVATAIYYAAVTTSLLDPSVTSLPHAPAGPLPQYSPYSYDAALLSSLITTTTVAPVHLPGMRGRLSISQIKAGTGSFQCGIMADSVPNAASASNPNITYSIYIVGNCSNTTSGELLQPGVPYGVVFYAEDFSSENNGDQRFLELVTPVSNSFTVQPYVSATATSDGVEFTIRVALPGSNGGSLWALIANEQWASGLTIAEIKSLQMSLRSAVW